MPLNSFAVSNFPVITGGRVAVGAGVGVDVPDISMGAKRCHRSSEIQRYTIAAKIAPKTTSTNRRHVRRRIFPTRLLSHPGDDGCNNPDHAQH
jgi:hypothetical protein